MKWLKVVFLGVVISISLSCILYASPQSTNVYNYQNPDITIEFSSDNELSDEAKQAIADEFAGIINEEEIGTEGIKNIICTLFGHNTSTTLVSVTHHKAYIHAPRCKIQYYDVTTCSRCDYNEKVLLGSDMIFCCPEDQIN